MDASGRSYLQGLADIHLLDLEIFQLFIQALYEPDLYDWCIAVERYHSKALSEMAHAFFREIKPWMPHPIFADSVWARHPTLDILNYLEPPTRGYVMRWLRIRPKVGT